MTNNHFEKRIQEKLNQFEIEPSENLLENIFEKRALRSKGMLKFSYFKIGAALLSVALISTVIAIYWNSPESNITLSHSSETVNAPDNEISDQLITEQTETENSNSLLNTTSDVNSSSQAKGIESFKATEKAIKKSPNLLPHLSNGLKKQKPGKRIKGSVESGKLAVASNSKKNLNKEGLKDQAKSNQQDYHDNGYNIEERYFNVDASNKPLIASIYHQGNSHLMVYHSVNKEKTDNLNLNYLFLKPMKTFPNSNENEKVELIEYESTKQCIKSRKPIFVDVLFTPMMSFHKVDGYDQANSDYNSLPVSSYNKQFSGRISCLVSKHFGLFAGLGFMQLSTAYEGEVSKSESSERYETVTHYINDPIKGPIAFNTIDTINSTTTKQVNYDFKNIYDIISIPLGLNYNFGYKDFDFAVNGSALMNFYTHAEGSNADFVNNQITAFNSDKKQFGFGGGIGFMAAYKLTNRFKLIVEPNVQYFKINSQSNGNVVNEKVLNSGLSIGLRYILF